ncbi:MAG: hypothetical protein U0353_30330 [Sandaracinus sp.]
MSSGRIKRLLSLRERVRDAERAGENATKRVHEDAVHALSDANAASRAAFDALAGASHTDVNALVLLAQRRREMWDEETRATAREHDARAKHDAQRARRYDAERDVKLAEIARDRAERLEAAEAERRELRTADDRAGSTRHRSSDDTERRTR